MTTMIALLALLGLPMMIGMYFEIDKTEAEEEYVPDGR